MSLCMVFALHKGSVRSEALTMGSYWQPATGAHGDRDVCCLRRGVCSRKPWALESHEDLLCRPSKSVSFAEPVSFSE